MLRLEQSINSRLDRWPAVKRLVKDAYQLAWSLAPAGCDCCDAVLTTHMGYFVGFHDICPFSADDSMLLVHRINGLGPRSPCVADKVTVGLIDVESGGGFAPLLDTAAFNWQEGARAQWLGSHIVCNEIKAGGGVGARIIDPAGATVAQLDHPISTVHVGKQLAAGYDFARLARYDLAYSYPGTDPIDSGHAPSGDGLRITNLASGRSRIRLSLRELAEMQPLPSMDGAYHYVSHCQFSPAGGQLSFMHCWLEGKRRHSRLATYDTADGAATVHSDFDWVSHHCWEGEEAIIAYAGIRNSARRYYRLSLGDGTVRQLGDGAPVPDGHPQISPDGRLMLTDTYPDRRMRQHLLLYELDADRTRPVASLRIPRAFRYGVRCDFHPRWNRAGDMVCFDSPHPGIRSTCLLKL